MWCVGNESGSPVRINQTVAGDVFNVLLDDLNPEMLYGVQVVAVTTEGPGEPSQPVFILISTCPRNQVSV